MRQKNAEKWTEIQESHPEGRNQRAPPLEGKNREEIFGQVVNHAHRSVGPADRDEVSAKYIALGETGPLHDLPQFHVVENFHPQSLIRANRLINPPTHEVERAHTHVVVRAGISHLPWAVPKDKHRLAKSNNHVFT